MTIQKVVSPNKKDVDDVQKNEIEKILEIGKDIQGEGFEDLNQQDIEDILFEE